MGISSAFLIISLAALFASFLIVRAFKDFGIQVMTQQVE